ncbi:nuclear pore complex protein Nup54-like [Styela clava]|uniref:nuclear pore complex protein Nup54-like n=1 Tax=Styela clava TaxID=7725 RepID=UPI0019392AFA|nr:nuclear pore complex protein Nup54-like [Styela clava]XP_039256691.1 nuclear pore complex protein Nup54-like [Styela clava]
MAFSFGNKTAGTGSLFGQSGTTSAFGAKPATTASAFTFGAGSSSVTGFGAKTTASIFGGGNTGTSAFSGFGKTTTTASTGFSTGFTSTLGGGGLFGGNQQQQQQQQQQVQNSQDPGTTLLLNTASALSAPIVFGDERDAILAKWNQIQAFWGTGRGFYRKDGSHVTFTPENHFCRFKAVGYSCLPKTKDDEGLLAIVVNKKESEITSVGNDKISSVIHGILESKPNLSVKVDSVRSLPGDRTEITVYVEEQSAATGTIKRVPASELHAFVSQRRIQQQLQQNMAAVSCMPRAAMRPEQIKQILENPPSGIDAVIWEQAKADNPDPTSLIPVPMIGFSELQNRLMHQEMMAKQHQSRLDILSNKLHDLQQMQVNAQSMIEQNKRQYLQLSHRVLKVIIAQEICRKAGFAIQPDEEQLRVQLESIYSELSAPTQCRGRLNEMLSQMRMQHHHNTLASSLTSGQNRSDREGILDDEALSEIKLHLKKQQEGLNTLIGLLREDFEDLKLMEHGLTDEDALVSGMGQTGMNPTVGSRGSAYRYYR